MAFFRRADKVIIRDIQFFPQLLEERYDFIDVFDGLNTFFFSSPLNLLAVFVRAGQEKDVIAAQAVEPSQRVGNRRAVRVPNVKFGAWIVNRCGDIILSFSDMGFPSYTDK